MGKLEQEAKQETAEILEVGGRFGIFGRLAEEGGGFFSLVVLHAAA
jgi:hypothetical protein